MLPRKLVLTTWVVVFLAVVLLTVGGCSEPRQLEVSAVSALGVDGSDRPTGVTATFDPVTPEIFVVAEVTGAPAGLYLEAVWIWEEENYNIDSFGLELPRGSSRPSYSFTRPDKGWPDGNYRVELIADGELAATVRFQVISQEQLGAEIFSDTELGFSLELPPDWKHERVSPWIYLFRGPTTTDQYYTTVNIQKLATQAAGGIYTDLDSVYGDYRTQFESAHGQILSQGEGVFAQGNNEFPTIDFVAEYRLSGNEFRQWTVIIQSSSDWFHQFSYTAPIDLYDDHLPLATEIWSSLLLSDSQ